MINRTFGAGILGLMLASCSAGHPEGSQDQGIGEAQQELLANGGYELLDGSYYTMNTCQYGKVLVGIDQPSGNGLCAQMTQGFISEGISNCNTDYTGDCLNDRVAIGFNAADESLYCCKVTSFDSATFHDTWSSIGYVSVFNPTWGFDEEFFVCNNSRAIWGWDPDWASETRSPYRCRK
ncbi:MAG TPA: hypothetical protein VJN18_03830 [Polyangiaceae bacterium]|nr:hypothetical protein [Polyangiaceae bacterium]